MWPLHIPLSHGSQVALVVIEKSLVRRCGSNKQFVMRMIQKGLGIGEYPSVRRISGVHSQYEPYTHECTNMSPINANKGPS